MSNMLPALARPALPASPTPILDESPHRWLAVEPPDRHSKLPSVTEESALKRELVAANAPATVDDLERSIMKMVGAFPQRGPVDSRPYVLALAENLAEYPADVVQAACREIVRNSKFPPSVAEVVEVAERRVERRRFALRSVCAVPAERERRRLAEEQEREHREAAARWQAAGERARLRLAAALPGPERCLDLSWRRLSAHRRITLTCAAQQGDDALDAAIAEMTADLAEPVDDSEIPF